MKKRKITILLLPCMLAMSLTAFGGETETAAPEAELTVRATEYGKVQGAENGENLVWYHIPYAAAPIDELRWAAPAKPEAWQDVLDCTEPGEAFLQCGTDYTTGEIKVSGVEDALNLDIYAGKTAENLPVLVYIHGGNNQTGTSMEVPGNQITADENCVYVSLNYRLGLLGFNCLPALQTEADATGNYALLDIAQALDWVKENIAAFGGNPDNITVSGFSAGGRDVMAMLTSSLFKGKFDKAIVFSGGMTMAKEDTSADLIAAAIAPFAVEDGKAPDETAAAEWLLTDGEDVKEYLYSIPADKLVTLMTNASIRMSGFPHLYQDGVVLPEEGFDTAEYNSVPLLMLTGSTEFSLFSQFDGYFFSDAVMALSEEEQNQAKAFAVNYGSDMYRIFNAQCSAQAMYDHYDADIYVCQVEYGSMNSQTQIPAMGSFHGIFVPMLTQDHTYGNFADFSTAGYADMASLFDHYLTAFLASGNPNGEGSVEWTAWTAEDPKSMVLDADAEKATAEMKDVTSSYEAIMESMDEDTTVSDPIKKDIIANVMNGRWFSAALDAKYGNAGL
ncbi:MAG: carboxylesterase family protein [Lachnospiraceae bacterium]|nr:carboxylesterase family protein [Lachnospiraceae bacterium]